MKKSLEWSAFIYTLLQNKTPPVPEPWLGRARQPIRAEPVHGLVSARNTAHPPTVYIRSVGFHSTPTHPHSNCWKDIMTYFRFEFNHRQRYECILGVVSDMDGKDYYDVVDLMRFLKCSGKAFQKYRNCEKIMIDKRNIACERYMVEYTILMNALERMDSDQSRFLRDFLQRGNVRPLYGNWFNEHRVQKCDTGQPYLSWLEEFKEHYGPYCNHTIPQYEKCPTCLRDS